MNRAYIALGSNISIRENYLEQALEALSRYDLITIKKRSSIYETDPVGYEQQEKFLNQVVEIDTSYSALELLEVCQLIEAELGREREIRWGPRTIDLDILLYNQENIIEDKLIIPHLRMHERAFVLVPLVELDPNIVIPTINRTVHEQLSLIPKQEKRGVVKWIKRDGAEE
ncbi:2-amino-4-hydroxy-6-hydroxymethyldihydropteridine diphosphokinase [Amphibacillus sp. MSJ-3]|uniref:2-amino-4-hydroxy-6- hydroxymethyldihydropteridine diphosphokinase n=1 Tax=Amphibacillus sp. MSJ-3 TaxID=2841505 RepID=UPI001C0EB3F4|nr:2-amino-4-hydroxy-6-hydroxymethyldihydropteridine diphosphokinase [Amphibacillus sp. MSJ-3]MBU5595522.1 2-amino-4-hydroxy-6-hydroxymethyldihydropteridine diphosphokinase [Amphibacillus sp. MSJ-3]